MIVQCPDRRGHVMRASDFHLGRTRGIHCVPLPANWPIVGRAIRRPQVVLITTTTLSALVQRVTTNTVSGRPVVTVHLSPDVLFPQSVVINVKSIIESARPGLTYVNSGSPGVIDYLNQDVDQRTITPSSDLGAPVVAPNEPWIAADFLHLHIGPPCDPHTRQAFATLLFNSTIIGDDQRVSAAELALEGGIGLAAMARNGPRFRSFKTMAWGPAEPAAITYDGDGTPVPANYQSFVDNAASAPQYWRDVLGQHAAAVNALSINGVTYEYMGENPTQDDLIGAITEFFGFDLG